MRLIFVLFTLQTLLITLSYHLPFPVILKVNTSALIYVFHTKRFHQVLNVLFLISALLSSKDKIRNMVHYLKTRHSLYSVFIFLFYLSLLFLYLEFLPKDYLYRRGYFIIVTLLLVYLPRFFKEDTIKNPTKFIPSELSFCLESVDGQRLPINHPEAGLCVIGGQGSGKTKSVIEPILFQMIKKGYAGILYDYDYHPLAGGKDFSLTHLAYHCLETFSPDTKFISINFEDLTKSTRINPVHPSYIKDRDKLSQAVHTLLLNLNPSSGSKDDFWRNNTSALLKAIIVFLDNKYPEFCTLPHAMQLGQDELALEAIQTDAEARSYGAPILDAAKTPGPQFTGVISSFKIAMEKLLSPSLVWVLSGQDMLPVVNDPLNPYLVCLGNTTTKKDIFSPVLAMLASIMIHDLYAHARRKSFVVLDELPTIVLPNLAVVPATGRKYGISTVVAIQNLAQLEKAYTDVGAREIQNSFINQFVGRGTLDAAKYISDMMGKKETTTFSTSKTGKKTTTTEHKNEKLLVTPQEAMSLPTGTFMGKVVSFEGGFFKIKLKPLEAYSSKLNYKNFAKMPDTFSEVDVEGNYHKIKDDVKSITRILKQNTYA